MKPDDITTDGNPQAARRALHALVVARLSWVIAGALVATAVTATFTLRVDADDNVIVRSVTATGCTYDTRHDPGRAHVTHPVYRVNPPSGGNHDPSPAAAGIYTTAVPADGRLVHALEHGLVVVWVDPLVPGPDQRRAEALATEFRPDVIVVARAGLPAPFVVTAWHRRLSCVGVDEVAARAFVCAFRSRGPERISVPGPGCHPRLS